MIKQFMLLKTVDQHLYFKNGLFIFVPMHGQINKTNKNIITQPQINIEANRYSIYYHPDSDEKLNILECLQKVNNQTNK